MAGLLVLQDEAAPLGLQINWTKTKIQQVGEPRLTQPTVQVAAENVDLVNYFVYLGSLISNDGGSETEIYTVSQKNCANIFFVRTLPNFDRL